MSYIAVELKKVLSMHHAWCMGYVELYMELVTITENEHSKQQDAHRAFTPSVTFIAEHRNNFLDIYHYRE